MSDEDALRPPRVYHGFGGRLFHRVPECMREYAIFQIRVGCAPGGPALTSPNIAQALLASVRFDTVGSNAVRSTQ